MGPEAKLERHCVAAARKHGCDAIKMTGARGFPDRMFIGPGGSIAFVEFKSPRGSLTRLQAYWLAALRAKGCATAVVRSPEEFLTLMRSALL